jgi:hypothetical protein
MHAIRDNDGTRSCFSVFFSFRPTQLVRLFHGAACSDNAFVPTAAYSSHVGMYKLFFIHSTGVGIWLLFKFGLKSLDLNNLLQVFGESAEFISLGRFFKSLGSWVISVYVCSNLLYIAK